MRAVNTYVSGNWSQPLLIVIDELCMYYSMISTTSSISIRIFSTPSNSESMNTLSIIIMHNQMCSSVELGSDQLIGVSIGIIFLPIAVGAIVFIIGAHWLLRKRKRRMESIRECEVSKTV